MVVPRDRLKVAVDLTACLCSQSSPWALFGKHTRNPPLIVIYVPIPSIVCDSSGAGGAGVLSGPGLPRLQHIVEPLGAANRALDPMLQHAGRWLYLPRTMFMSTTPRNPPVLFKLGCEIGHAMSAGRCRADAGRDRRRLAVRQPGRFPGRWLAGRVRHPW